MIISAREKAQVQAARSGVESAGAAGLNTDEWQFLRATPDYDAEEMSSVLSSPAGAAAPSWLPPPVAAPEAPPPLRGPLGEFPETSALAEMLGDLVETPEQPAADPVWAAVPAAEEWASLMEPQDDAGDSSASPTGPALEAPPPVIHDALMDALAACERAGLMPRSEGGR